MLGIWMHAPHARMHAEVVEEKDLKMLPGFHIVSLPDWYKQYKTKK